MVFQNPVASFDPRMKIRNSLCEALLNFKLADSRLLASEKADELMRMVGLSPMLADRFPHELSGGQCQRAAIARALAVNPELLICDEATSALDVSAQAHIVELLSKIQAQRKMGILFISHDIALVSSICNRVIVMQNGRCVEQGDTSQIIQSPQEDYTKLLISSVL